jgi:hypothetical protein
MQVFLLDLIVFCLIKRLFCPYISHDFPVSVPILLHQMI